MAHVGHELPLVDGKLMSILKRVLPEDIYHTVVFTEVAIAAHSGEKAFCTLVLTERYLYVFPQRVTAETQLPAPLFWLHVTSISCRTEAPPWLDPTIAAKAHHIQIAYARQRHTMASTDGVRGAQGYRLVLYNFFTFQRPYTTLYAYMRQTWLFAVTQLTKKLSDPRRNFANRQLLFEEMSQLEIEFRKSATAEEKGAILEEITSMLEHNVLTAEAFWRTRLYQMIVDEITLLQPQRAAAVAEPTEADASLQAEVARQSTALASRWRSSRSDSITQSYIAQKTRKPVPPPIPYADLPVADKLEYQIVLLETLHRILTVCPAQVCSLAMMRLARPYKFEHFVDLILNDLQPPATAHESEPAPAEEPSFSSFAPMRQPNTDLLTTSTTAPPLGTSLLPPVSPATAVGVAAGTRQSRIRSTAELEISNTQHTNVRNSTAPRTVSFSEALESALPYDSEANLDPRVREELELCNETIVSLLCALLDVAELAHLHRITITPQSFIDRVCRHSGFLGYRLGCMIKHIQVLLRAAPSAHRTLTLWEHTQLLRVCLIHHAPLREFMITNFAPLKYVLQNPTLLQSLEASKHTLDKLSRKNLYVICDLCFPGFAPTAPPDEWHTVSSPRSASVATM